MGQEWVWPDVYEISIDLDYEEIIHISVVIHVYSINNASLLFAACRCGWTGENPSGPDYPSTLIVSDNPLSSPP